MSDISLPDSFSAVMIVCVFWWAFIAYAVIGAVPGFVVAGAVATALRVAGQSRVTKALGFAAYALLAGSLLAFVAVLLRDPETTRPDVPAWPIAPIWALGAMWLLWLQGGDRPTNALRVAVGAVCFCAILLALASLGFLGFLA